MTAYGAVPFVADSAAVVREAARVLRPGGRFVFSTTHPIRWAFPDVPGEAGLTAASSYFDRSPYVEEDEAGQALYVEHHRTLGDRVREIVAAGLTLVDLVEPEWPEGTTRRGVGGAPAWSPAARDGDLRLRATDALTPGAAGPAQPCWPAHLAPGSDGGTRSGILATWTPSRSPLTSRSRAPPISP